jgi:hypothetical protein
MVTLALFAVIGLNPYAQHVADRVCGEEVVMVDFYDNKNVGMWSDKIYIQEGLPKDDMRMTIVHECCHAMFDTLPKDDIFGKPPYVNSYAATDYEEDYCESYAYHRVGKLNGVKDLFFRSLEITK